MDDNFYRAFEDKYRGSRELITSRLEVYLPFVRPLLEHYPHAKSLDLGCGRGEWLGLLSSAGFDAKGVDLDEGMLEACYRLGLNAEKGDALTALRALPDASTAVVSAFHLVEHIPFEQLQVLVGEALRVLAPGGLLIMETPNPENIVVAGCDFYTDPSHMKPIPPQLLSFVAEHVGYERVKVLRLQEASELRDAQRPLNLGTVLDSVSPDYAVVAQKAGSQAVLECNAMAFQREYGVTLRDLADRYNLQRDAQLNKALAKAQQALAKAQQAEMKSVQAEAAAARAAEILDTVLTSRSWRITAPLRQIMALLRGDDLRNAKQGVKRQLSRVARYGARKAWIRRPVLLVLNRLPGLKSRLARIAASERQDVAPEARVDHLSPHAHQVYVSLKSRISRKKPNEDG